MPNVVLRVLTFAFAVAAVCVSALAEDAGITAKLHPWGRFDPGAWKLVHVVTETLDERGQVVGASMADTKTTLIDIDNDGVTLEIETCMEVAGKRFQAEPQTVKQGFHGELNGPNLRIQEPTSGETLIENRSRPCKIQQLDVLGPTERTTVRLYYSAALWPHVLRREIVTSDLEGKNVSSETSVEVVALDMPVRFREETHGGAFIKTVHKNAKGTVTELATFLPGVPGGVVSNSTKDVDKSGRLVRRSTLELVDYNVSAEKDRPLFNRKHPSRRGKSSSR